MIFFSISVIKWSENFVFLKDEIAVGIGNLSLLIMIKISSPRSCFKAFDLLKNTFIKNYLPMFYAALMDVIHIVHDCVGTNGDMMG